jgi:hypothetical protein
VLVDPWLVSDLRFFNQGWAYIGRKRVLVPGRLNVEDVASETDVLLLSQARGGAGGGRGRQRLPGLGCSGARDGRTAGWGGPQPQWCTLNPRHRPTTPLYARANPTKDQPNPNNTPNFPQPQYLDDHTHMPTLERLPKSIPVIAQPEAAARIAPLGFTDVRTIAPGASLDACGGRLRVTATAGALVGPPWSARQNGYVLQELGAARPTRLYYEPHCGEAGGRLRGGGLARRRCPQGCGPAGGAAPGLRGPKARATRARKGAGVRAARPQRRTAWVRAWPSPPPAVAAGARLAPHPPQAKKTLAADFDESSVASVGRVDVVVSPVLDVLLGGYPLVKGGQELTKVGRGLRTTACMEGVPNGLGGRMAWAGAWLGRAHGTGPPRRRPQRGAAEQRRRGRGPERSPSPPPQLLRLLRPSVLVPLLNADLDQEGGLTALMSTRGDLAALRDTLAAAGLSDVDVDMPAPPGEAFAIAL